MNKVKLRTLILAIIAIVCVVWIALTTLSGVVPSGNRASSPMSQFQSQIERSQLNKPPQFEMDYTTARRLLYEHVEQVEKLELNTVTAEVTFYQKNGERDVVSVTSSIAQEFIDTAAQSKIPVRIVNKTGATELSKVTGIVIPVIIVLALLFIFFRGAQAGPNAMARLGKNKAERINPEDNPVRFDKVAGCEEAKLELQEIVEFLKEPEFLIEQGIKIPKGVLLVGPPGTGKTLLAKAVSGEAEVPFFSISGSEFVEMFVGVGAARVRDLFEQAKKTEQPCIIFVDEIDALGRQRGAGVGGGNDEREQTLNQLLTEMDGFKTREHPIIIIAATNRPDVLDSALMRPGRFDRQVNVDPPDLEGRTEILEIYIGDKPVDPKLDLAAFAAQHPGATGADIEAMVNEALILRNRRINDWLKANQGKTREDAPDNFVTEIDLRRGLEKQQFGPELESKQKNVSQKDKEITAYHEIGHALLHTLLKGGDFVDMISIIRTSKANGFTSANAGYDRTNLQKFELLAQIVVFYGGRASEEFFLNSCSTGASNDIERAWHLAADYVTKYGMSCLGMIHAGEAGQSPFLGRRLSQGNYHIGPVFNDKIDDTIQLLVNSAMAFALELMEQHQEFVHAASKELIANKRIDRVRWQELITQHNLPVHKVKIPVLDVKSEKVAA